MQFTKYHGSGNDFILIDNRQNQWAEFLNQYTSQSVITKILPQNSKEYSKENLTVFELCHRNFGIGADGLMLLQHSSMGDFEMVYFNSDGHLSSMCGNGGRCIAHFAAKLGMGLAKKDQIELSFTAPDGMHKAAVDVSKNWVELSMNPVFQINHSRTFPTAWVLNTGSPHFVDIIPAQSLTFINDNHEESSFLHWGKSIRYSEEFSEHGINVNLVSEMEPSLISIRTYERGVENETLSCGTGVTAAAIAYYQQRRNLHLTQTTAEPVTVRVNSRGGDLVVQFIHSENGFVEITLSGPALPVFTGIL